MCPNLIGGGYQILRIFAVHVLSIIIALSTIAVPCKAEETRHITIQFDDTFFDGTAARIDGGPNAPGYFTNIADKPLVATQSLEETQEDSVSEGTEEYEFVPAPYSQEEISMLSEN